MSKPRFESLFENTEVKFRNLDERETFTKSPTSSLRHLLQKLPIAISDSDYNAFHLETGGRSMVQPDTIVYRRHIKIVEITEAEANPNA